MAEQISADREWVEEMDDPYARFKNASPQALAFLKLLDEFILSKVEAEDAAYQRGLREAITVVDALYDSHPEAHTEYHCACLDIRAKLTRLAEGT